MARGSKNNKRTNAIHKMVESIIKGDSAEAEEHLHECLTILSRETILGEAEDESNECPKCGKEDCECEDKDDKDKDKEGSDDDDDDDDEDLDEMAKNHPEGAMSRKVGKFPKSSGKGKIEKHGNSAAHLDDKIKGKAKYNRFPGKGKMKKHANVKDDYDKSCDGRDKNLGTTD